MVLTKNIKDVFQIAFFYRIANTKYIIVNLEINDYKCITYFKEMFKQKLKPYSIKGTPMALIKSPLRKHHLNQSFPNRSNTLLFMHGPIMWTIWSFFLHPFINRKHMQGPINSILEVWSLMQVQSSK